MNHVDSIIRSSFLNSGLENFLGMAEDKTKNKCRRGKGKTRRRRAKASRRERAKNHVDHLEIHSSSSSDSSNYYLQDYYSRGYYQREDLIDVESITDSVSLISTGFTTNYDGTVSSEPSCDDSLMSQEVEALWRGRSNRRFSGRDRKGKRSKHLSTIESGDSSDDDYSYIGMRMSAC